MGGASFPRLQRGPSGAPEPGEPRWRSALFWEARVGPGDCHWGRDASVYEIPRRLRKALRRELDDNLVFRPKADSGRGSLCARDRRRISSLIHSHQPSRCHQGGLLPVAIDMTE